MERAEGVVSVAIATLLYLAYRYRRQIVLWWFGEREDPVEDLEGQSKQKGAKKGQALVQLERAEALQQLDAQPSDSDSEDEPKPPLRHATTEPAYGASTPPTRPSTNPTPRS